MFEGSDIVELAKTRVGQKYVLGARVHLANRDWSGPWDCAEFVSWACYHAYKQVIAVRPPNIQTGESYSGWWHEASRTSGRAISVTEALGTVGAILIRHPGFAGNAIGHVAISCGNNTTVEAHSRNVGVAVLKDAHKRDWSGGWLVPVVSYAAPPAKPAKKHNPPKNVVRLTDPFTRGDEVVRIQEKLLAAGINPGPVDGIFGNATAVAVAAFQAEHGLVVDGVVGPETRKALGI